MTVDFKSLLSMPVEAAEKPKPKPTGTYTGFIESYKFDTSRKQKTPFVRFTITGVVPGEDISAEDIQASGVRLSDWKPTTDFYITNDALYRLREFQDSCGISSEGKSFNETIPQLKGKPVMFSAINENVTNEQTGEMNTYTRVENIRGA